ncbi:hypothetical protein IQ03_04686 [Gemmobacter caeni]|uniref:DUF2946 family protein n=1 Tax=Gemmobacter caeni TaxID=589035 RepID=A0A2T6B4A3_9RHOB|nr:hypothetical protein [Gemmobacter caeni]PTX50916.1 hypothetical protein C8N34_10432 [Gemmobacter caeni]TWI93574.1 hypothetical protein IQ03_04686 [Gemmobacter caeni]
MRRFIRHLTGMFVLLAFVAGALGLGVARALPVAVSEMEICSEGQTRLLSVDAAGRPVGPVHLCPDCVIGASAAPPGSLPPPERPAGRITRAEWPAPHAEMAQARPRPSARGPPVLS